ncbi:hypothetical protein C2869_10245 [Saccharobesus litoralis]|uniref:diguanylate cyclase n=1 Tax=Saccharobesus litoralis TaxID=2172099 RepID=A0A2S0VRF5_9ALTE|nr:hypothetical protein C2869_10245 [Saccharobesus litoralis]
MIGSLPSVAASETVVAYNHTVLGFMLAAGFASLLLWFITKGIRCLFYGLYIVLAIFWLNSLQPNYNIAINQIGLHWSAPILTALILLSQLFTPTFFRQSNAFLQLIDKVLLYLPASWLLIVWFLPSEWGMMGTLTLALLNIVHLLSLGILTRRYQTVGVDAYLAAWGLPLTTLLYFFVSYLHLAPFVLSVNLAAFCLLGQTVFLAIASASVYGQERNEKLAAQENALQQAKQASEAQQQLIQLQQEQQEELEAMVRERTFELEVTLRELQDKNQELEEKNTLDPLTGIRNRRFFDKKLLAEYRRSRRELSELTVMMLDIDHFKSVNDNYGHQAGDDVIRCVAKIAEQAAKRPSDSVCRYGGEEFSLILPATEPQGAMQIAEAIRRAIAEHPIHTSAGPLSITASLGIATRVASVQFTEKDLLQLADDALYQAKQNGRNRVEVAQDDNNTLKHT